MERAYNALQKRETTRVFCCDHSLVSMAVLLILTLVTFVGGQSVQGEAAPVHNASPSVRFDATLYQDSQEDGSITSILKALGRIQQEGSSHSGSRYSEVQHRFILNALRSASSPYEDHSPLHYNVTEFISNPNDAVMQYRTASHYASVQYGDPPASYSDSSQFVSSNEPSSDIDFDEVGGLPNAYLLPRTTDDLNGTQRSSDLMSEFNTVSDHISNSPSSQLELMGHQNVANATNFVRMKVEAPFEQFSGQTIYIGSSVSRGEVEKPGHSLLLANHEPSLNSSSDFDSQADLLTGGYTSP